MPVSATQLQALILSASGFDGPASSPFAKGIATGVTRCLTEATVVTMMCTGAAGSPGQAILIGIPSANAAAMEPVIVSNMLAATIAGAAMPFLASGLAQIGACLQTTATTFVPAVPGIATGTGTIQAGGVVCAAPLAGTIIGQQLVASGIRLASGQLTAASTRLVQALGLALSQYLATLTYAVPIVGGSPSSGGASTPVVGPFLS